MAPELCVETEAPGQTTLSGAVGGLDGALQLAFLLESPDGRLIEEVLLVHQLVHLLHPFVLEAPLREFRLQLLDLPQSVLEELR